MSNRLKEYLEYISPRRSKWTVKGYRETLERYVLFLKDQEPTRENALSFLNWLGWNGCGARSLNRHLSTLRSYFKFLGKKLDIEGYYIEKKLPVWLSENEQALYLSAVETPYERALVNTFLHSGVRLEELSRLKREDIRKSEEGYFLRVLGKRGKERLVGVHNEVISIIMQWLETRGDSDPRIFPQSRGVIGQLIKKIGLRVGLTVTPHILRHTYAANYAAKAGEGGLVDLRDQLGHSSVTTTNLYLHTSPLERRKRLPAGV